MARTGDIAGLPGKMTEADSEGHKMSQNRERRLPNELLFAIGEQLCSDRDIVAFGMTCTDMYITLVKKGRPSLRIHFDGSQHGCKCTACTEADTRTYRLLNQKSAMLTLPLLGAIFEYYENTLRSSSGSAYAREVVAAKQLFAQNGYRLAKSIKELILCGSLDHGYFNGCSLASYPFIQSAGFKRIRLETFRVDLHWSNWNIDVLQSVSTANLKCLKLPTSLPSDCVRLGQALTFMPRLESLAITDIPDQQEFLTELQHVGKGIISCASTLQELHIEMTNCNRLTSWGGDEPFIEPEDDGFFFRKLFPCTTDELSALCNRQSRHDRDPTSEAPLGLRKLRLKHVNLPWDSFGIIFKATSIKHLQLPCSKADEQVWTLLQTHAQLDTLTDISYGMLSAGFLDFLAGQSSLKEMTFARPQDRYEAGPITFDGETPYMTIIVSEAAPRLGPDIGAKYPSLEDFLSSLTNMTMLKHLVLPADMYTITPGCLSSVAASLTSLEYLQLGFDYENAELRDVFASCFLCGTGTLKKLTFLYLKQPQPLRDFDSTQFHAYVASLGDKVSANLKLVRYMALDCYGTTEVYYHRDTPVHGEWWLRLPPNEREEIFAEGRTPRIVPVGKWGSEREAE